MTRSHRRWGWFLNFGNFGDYGNFGNSSCLRGRCCFSDYGAYVRFRATCPACPGVAVGPCRGSRAILILRFLRFLRVSKVLRLVSQFWQFSVSPCLRGRCCFSDYGAYVRFRATCPACPGVAVGPCRAITGDLHPSLNPFPPCFKGVGVGFSILAIPAIMAILAISSFALTCPGLPWIRGQTFPDPRSSA